MALGSVLWTSLTHKHFVVWTDAWLLLSELYIIWFLSWASHPVLPTGNCRAEMGNGQDTADVASVGSSSKLQLLPARMLYLQPLPLDAMFLASSWSVCYTHIQLSVLFNAEAVPVARFWLTFITALGSYLKVQRPMGEWSQGESGRISVLNQHHFSPCGQLPTCGQKPPSCCLLEGPFFSLCCLWQRILQRLVHSTFSSLHLQQPWFET